MIAFAILILIILAGIPAAFFLKRVFDPIAREFGWWK